MAQKKVLGNSEALLAKIKNKKTSTKTGNKHKFAGRNNKPSRVRYWASHRLEHKKIRNLVECCGMTETDAYLHWHATRIGRLRK